jgi:cytochrome c oxidase cbb3-type subunit I/II
MIRPFRAERLRYGEPSRIEESAWDHPFQWGSKRTGPDLARVGAKYGDDWHWLHMKDPRQMTPQSNMPAYPWLFEQDAQPQAAVGKMRVLKRLGVPYTDQQIAKAVEDYVVQASGVAMRLSEKGIETHPAREIVALIAYLQRLGRNQKPERPQVAEKGR